MKTSNFSFIVVAAACCALFINPVQAAIVTKASSGTDLTAGASWGGTAPTTADTAMWTNSSLGAGLTLATSKGWSGISVTNAASDIYIGGAGALTNGAGGIDMSASVVNLTITNAIVFSAAQTWTVKSGLGLTNYGGVSGAFTLNKAGAGTVTLSGNIANTGITTVSGGTLNVLSNFNTYANRALTINSGATAQSAATINVNVNQNGSVNSTNITGAGTLRLISSINSTSSPDIYFGPDHSGTSYYGAWINSAILDLGSSQRFIFAKTGHNSISQYYPKSDAVIGSSIIGSGGITYIAQTNYTVSFPMEVPLALAGSNSFTGPLEIQRGSVYLMNPNALTQTNTLFLNSSGTYNARFFLFGNNVTVGNLASSAGGTNLIANANVGNTNAITTNAVTLTVNQSSNTTYSGVLVNAQAEYDKGTYTAGALALAVTGSATLTLAGANTYTGPTTVSAGTLQISGLLGNGTYAALITNNATLTLSNTASQTFSGTISGTGALNKANTGTLTLSGTNTYSGGTTLSAGTLSIPIVNALGTGALNASPTAAATLTIANTSAFNLTNNIVLGAPGSAQTFNIVKNSSGIATGTQLNLTGNVSGGNSNIKLFLNSSTGSDNTTTYRFAGNNTFQVSRVELNRGGIVVANPSAMGNPANLVYLDGNNNSTLGDLRFETSMTFTNPIQFVSGGSSTVGTDTNNVVLLGQVSGVNLVKVGTGTLTLNGGNTYTGNTTVKVGTLAVGTAGTMPPSALITVAANATLDVSGLTSPVMAGGQTLTGSGGGSANVAGSFQDSAGSIITPGGTAAVGTLAFTGNLTLAGSDTLNFDLGKTPTSAGGTNNDLITVASNLTINASTVVNINPILALAGGTYKLISYNGTLNGAGNTASWTVGSYTPSGRVTGVAISEATPGEIDLIVSGSPAPLVWQGDGSINAWDVQTTTNWLNIGTPDQFYQFDNTLFTDSGSNSPAVDIQAAVTPSSVVVSNNVENYTFNSSVGQGISGGGTLTKSGTGTLTILNNNNPYTGITTINNGALVLGDGVSYDGSLSASPIVNNATLEFNIASAQTAAAAISGSGTVVQTGNINGTLTLNASNSWTGGLTIQNGTAKPGVNYGLPAGESVIVSNGAAFDFNGINNGTTTTRANTFTIAGAGPDGVSGALINSSVSQVLSYTSISNLVLSADATVGGNDGRWDVGPQTNSVLNGQGHNLTKTGSVLLDMRPQLVTNVASITVNSGELRYESYSQTNTWTSAITNYVSSGATLGSYATTVNYPVVLDNATIQSDSGTATWLGNIGLTSTSIFSTATGAQLFSGVVSGASSLTVQGGTGSVTLAASNSYTGGTTINAGTLVVANANALGTGDATINTGSLYFNFPTGTTNVVTNNIALPATGTQEFTLQGTPTNFTVVRLTGLISGGAAGQQYNLLDTGVTGNHFNNIVLDNPNNTFSGNILMNRGTLGFTSDAALGNVGTIVIDTWSVNGQLRFDADNLTINASRTLNLHTSGQIMPINVQSFNGTIAGVVSGPGTLVKQGTGTLTLTNVNTYTGNTTISAGTLTIGDPGQLNSGSYAGTIADNAALIYNSSAAQTLTGVISGTGTLTQNGPGTLTLNDSAVANTYTGDTFINGGTLTLTGTGVAGGTNKLASGTVWVNPGATLNLAAAGQFNYGAGTPAVVLNNSTLAMTDGQYNYIKNLTLTNGATWALGTGSSINGLTGANFSLTNITSQASANTSTITSRGGAISASSGVTFNVGRGTAASDLAVSANLADYNGTQGSVTKTGNGILMLNTNNTYTGNTIITSGTLAVGATGSIGGTTNLLIAGSATLDVSAAGLTLSGSQTLANSSSTAVLNGNVNASLGTLALGFASGTPSLNVTNGTLTLAPTSTIKVNNTSAPLAIGSYKLVSKATAGNVGSVTGTVPTAFALGGNGMVGGATNSLQITGGELYLVVTATVNTTPTNIVSTVSGNTLTLAWPMDHTGWKLQVQTNTLTTGLGTNWFDWPYTDSTATNSVSVTLDPNAPTVFFRMVY